MSTIGTAPRTERIECIHCQTVEMSPGVHFDPSMGAAELAAPEGWFAYDWSPRGLALPAVRRIFLCSRCSEGCCVCCRPIDQGENDE